MLVGGMEGGIVKRLSNRHLYELRNGMGDPNREEDWDDSVVQELVDAGYLLQWRDGDWDYVKTSPKGELALRCHEALTRSLTPATG